MAQYKGAASEGSRAMQLQKKREKEAQEVEFRKNKIKEELRVDKMENKFKVHYDAIEASLKSSTIGLVTLDEMKAKQDTAVKEREQRLAQRRAEKEQKKIEELEALRAQKELQKKQIRSLSFRGEEEEENEEEDEEEDQVQDPASESKDSSEEEDGDFQSFCKPSAPKKKKIGKNPDVDTSFLPDREREEEENRLREQLRQEWVTAQEALKNESMEVTYSYWDGSGHRRTLKLTKGTSIYQFLQRCLESLRSEFGELRTVTADQLMYVKEDLILPHHYTFYDLIVTKARGKSGPLFAFHARDDIRMTSDASREKEDSHAGKVLLRNWYERNKHIFPASRWEPYDPNKTYAKYTISDKSK